MLVIRGPWSGVPLPFYQSTGSNSHLGGTWFPFRGYMFQYTKPSWNPYIQFLLQNKNMRSDDSQGSEAELAVRLGSIECSAVSAALNLFNPRTAFLPTVSAQGNLWQKRDPDVLDLITKQVIDFRIRVIDLQSMLAPISLVLKDRLTGEDDLALALCNRWPDVFASEEEYNVFEKQKSARRFEGAHLMSESSSSMQQWYPSKIIPKFSSQFLTSQRRQAFPVGYTPPALDEADLEDEDLGGFKEQNQALYRWPTFPYVIEAEQYVPGEYSDHRGVMARQHRQFGSVSSEINTNFTGMVVTPMWNKTYTLGVVPQGWDVNVPNRF